MEEEEAQEPSLNPDDLDLCRSEKIEKEEGEDFLCPHGEEFISHERKLSTAYRVYILEYTNPMSRFAFLSTVKQNYKGNRYDCESLTWLVLQASIMQPP